jgi:hypothetical protein
MNNYRLLFFIVLHAYVTVYLHGTNVVTLVIHLHTNLFNITYNKPVKLKLKSTHNFRH